MCGIGEYRQFGDKLPGFEGVAFLENLKDKNPHKMIYCEKVWVHREELGTFGDVRPMRVPTNLK